MLGGLLREAVVVLGPLEPMLATAGRPSPAYRWGAEPKLDGWRAIVHIDGTLRIRTRSGRDITNAMPELAGLADALGGRQAVLDGELVAGQGRPRDFYRLGPSLARRRRTGPPLTFVAFDLLAFDGQLLIGERYEHRRRMLQELSLAGPGWHNTPAYVDDFVAVVDACEHLRLKGIVLKRLDSRYRPGRRSRDWLKLKTVEWRTAHAPLRQER